MTFTKMTSGALVAGLAVLASTSAFAFTPHTPTTKFASFSNVTGTPFTFTNTGTGGTFTASTDATFFYLNNTPDSYFPGNGQTTAHLTITGHATVPATQSGGNDTQLVSIDDLKFTALTPVNGKTNLLEVKITSAKITGTDTGDTGNLAGDTRVGDTVNYSSDFLDFSKTTDRNFSIALDPISAANGNGITINADGFLNTFSSGLDGSFSSNPLPQNPTPEPTSTAAFAMGGFGIFGLLFAKKRRNSTAV